MARELDEAIDDDYNPGWRRRTKLVTWVVIVSMLLLAGGSTALTFLFR